MNDDLAAVLAEASAQQARTVGHLADAGVHGLLREVARRRTARRLRRSAMGVAAVGVVGVLGWVGLTRTAPVVPVVPVATPTSAAATPPVTSAPTAPVGMPPSVPLPAGLLTEAQPGWVLTVHVPTSAAAQDVDPGLLGSTEGLTRNRVGAALFLVSPAGARYHLIDLPLDSPLEVVHWTAGTERALVNVGKLERGEGTPGWLDLTTGAITGLTTEKVSVFLGVTPDGASVWQGQGDEDGLEVVELGPDGAVVHRWTDLGDAYEPLLSPQGTHVALAGPTGMRLLTLADGGVRQLEDSESESCGPVAWPSETELFVWCVDISPDAETTQGRLYRQSVDAPTSARTLVADSTTLGGEPWQGVMLDGRLVVSILAPAPGDCASGLVAVDGTQVSTLAAATGEEHHLGVEGTRLYVTGGFLCPGAAGPTTLTLRDVDAGTSVAIAPAPDQTPPAVAGEPQVWLSGLMSWAVGGGS
ncbi:hypothetical protein [Cellulomonas soli]